MKPFSRLLVLIGMTGIGASAVHAWDYEGHRMVNQVALAALPADFPAWVKTPENAERIAFLAGEPDRWRNSKDLVLQHYNGLDHYLDLEQLADAGIDVHTLTPFRYDFVAQYAAGRAAHPENFPSQDVGKDHTSSLPGLLPWAVAEYYAKLQSAFSYLKTFEAHGRPEEVANAKANILYLMGVMGHYVGDGAQPLHATKHHHGWVGENPHGYSTAYGIHSLIDGGFIAYAKIRPAELMPLVKEAKPLSTAPRPDERDPVFVQTVEYLQGSLQLVEPLYQMEKAGDFAVHGPVNAEGRKFIDAQLVRGGEMLGAIWLTAWRQAAPDTYLQRNLLLRADDVDR